MRSRLLRLTIAATCAAVPLVIGTRASAQGCEPIRFSTPVSLGGAGEAYQREREWRITLGYRRLYSNEWFVGTESAAARGPGGQSPVLNINTVIADVSFAPNARIQLHLGIPYSRGSSTSIWPDRLSHTQSVSGIGDISAVAEAWLLSPTTHSNGNLSLGLGFKAPTGSHSASSFVYTPAAAIPYPADQTVQPGDGGWGIIVQGQGFQKLTERLYGYAFGSYMASPKAHGDVQFRPGSGVYWSVPDIYSARVGAAFSVLPDQGLTMSLGGRMDGIPLRDVFGGGDDDTIKRTSRVMFVDPGVSLTRGKHNITVSAPWRVSVDRFKSLYEQKNNTLNGGGFAKHLIFASYSLRI
jgi:hypothetical protein